MPPPDDRRGEAGCHLQMRPAGENPQREAREGHTAESPGARGVGREKAGHGAAGALSCPESQRNFRCHLLETGHCSTKLSMDAEKTQF